MNANLRGVIASGGEAFELVEKTDFRKIGHLIVVRQDGEDGDPFLRVGVDERLSVVVLAHQIDQAEAFAPESPLVVIDAFAHNLLDVVGNLRGLRAAGVAIGRNDCF